MKSKTKRGYCDNCGKRRKLHRGTMWMDYDRPSEPAMLCRKCNGKERGNALLSVG